MPREMEDWQKTEEGTVDAIQLRLGGTVAAVAAVVGR